MSKNKEDPGFVGQIGDIRDRLSRFQKSHWIGRHRTIMLDDRVQVLTLSSQSDVSWTDLDLTAFTVTGGTGDISDETFACIFLIVMNDSGSAGTATDVSMRKNGASSAHLICDGSHINDAFSREQGIVGLDSNYICEYDLNASGAGTLDVTIFIIGYKEQL